MKPQIAVLVQSQLMGSVLSEAALDRLRSFAAVRLPVDTSLISLVEQAPRLMEVADGCILSWGSPRLDHTILTAAPDLEIVAYAAGSVKGIVTPELYARGVRVTSAASAIADEVTAYTLGVILCALKGVFQCARGTRNGAWGGLPSGDVSSSTVGIIGAGHVGRKISRALIDLPLGVKVLLYDPLLSAEDAKALGVELVELNDLLTRSNVVSVHAPSIPATRGMLNESNLNLLGDGATLVNCARGSVIDAAALASELERRPSLQAVIDVTDPEEPPSEAHPYRKLPNVILTPHIAGGVGRARARMGDLSVEELYRHFVTHEAPLVPVSQEMLPYLA